MSPLAGADGRADQAAQVDAVVAVEAAVLGGDRARPAGTCGTWLSGTGDAVLAEQRGDDGLAVAGVERGRLRRLGLLQVARGVEELVGLVPRDEAEAADVGQQPARRRGPRPRAGRRTSLPSVGQGSGRPGTTATGHQGTGRAERAAPILSRSAVRRRRRSQAPSSVADRRASPSRSWTSAGSAGTATSGTSGWADGEPLGHPGVVLGRGGDLGVHAQRRRGQRRGAGVGLAGQRVGGGLGPRGGQRLAARRPARCRVRLTTTPASGIRSAESRSTK